MEGEAGKDCCGGVPPRAWDLEGREKGRGGWGWLPRMGGLGEVEPMANWDAAEAQELTPPFMMEEDVFNFFWTEGQGEEKALSTSQLNSRINNFPKGI